MTDNELKDYIKQAVKDAMTECADEPKATPRLLTPTQQKWFADESGGVSQSVFGKVFDRGYKAYAFWDKIRIITVAITGKSYVRQIDPKDADKVNEIADRLCQCVYDCREDWKRYMRISCSTYAHLHPGSDSD